ncbi:uncharacterized protein LOC110457958 [Mizuhopecten yessoensis]|uniref:uncharacterized protein LOC110457958 n=1 Tax=Mizuhopecten yessoensis TaxID=6573 RepID=UPI000B458A01|nr:uncharacterized protein LOC110457958 [Mizuhopecten yessoensis]
MIGSFLFDLYVVNETSDSSFWNEICQAGCSSEEPYTDVYCSTQSADTYEDGGPALDLESSPFFPDPSLLSGDPKKSHKFHHLINKIRRAHNCPELFLPEIPQLDDSQSDDIDLEVDAPHSRPQTRPLFFQSEPLKSKKGKTGSFSEEPEKNDADMRNVRLLLETPAAKYLISMGYDSKAVLEAISSYTQAIGDVEFDVNDLLGILTGEDSKPGKAAVHND